MPTDATGSAYHELSFCNLQVTGKRPDWETGARQAISLKAKPKPVQTSAKPVTDKFTIWSLPVDEGEELLDDDDLLTEEDRQRPAVPQGKSHCPMRLLLPIMIASCLALVMQCCQVPGCSTWPGAPAASMGNLGLTGNCPLDLSALCGCAARLNSPAACMPYRRGLSTKQKGMCKLLMRQSGS